ncbi:hypothetical protein BDQ17DRAFT_1259951 [Cyathus striatus]|nr:hypothetical protein BDQ17DRAFT_1259951 [Cyathus striatus]
MQTARQQQPLPGEFHHYVWLGDFNHHHPLWDEDCNNHLFTPHHLTLAQPLLNLLQRYGMKLALPKDTPTLCAMGTGNYTRVDQVFLDEDLMDDLMVCSTAPDL